LADRYPITVDFARTLYENAGGGHDFDHVLRVTALAERIAAAEGADLRIVRTAALLHDIGESEGREDHHLRGAAKARALLLGEPDAFVEAVAHAIEAHRFRAEPAPATQEAQCLSDADKLDAIGAIGAARAIAYAAQVGQPTYAQPSQRFLETGQTEPGEPHSAYHEFVFKLRKLKDRLYTPSARQIGEERHRYLEEFFTQLTGEITGQR